MPSFRERPVTWLFFIATLAATAATISISRGESALVSGALLGESVVGSSAIVSSRMNRLLRGCLFVLAGVGIASLISFEEGWIEGRWDENFLGILIVQSAAAIGSALGSFLYRRRSPHSKSSSDRFRIQLIELFGWTIIIAIVSSLLRHTDWAILASSSFLLILTFVALLFGASIGWVLEACNHPQAGCLIPAIPIGIVGLASLLAEVGPPLSDGRLMFFSTSIFTAIFLACIVIDAGNRAAMHEELLKQEVRDTSQVGSNSSN